MKDLENKSTSTPHVRFVFAGPMLPQAIRQHTTLNYEDSFLILGGLHHDACGASNTFQRWIHR